MKPRIISVLLTLTVSALVVAQPVVGPPHFTVTPVTGPVALDAPIASMAADAGGSVFLLEGHRNLPALGARVHVVRPDGTFIRDHASVQGVAEGLAYDPTDGLVYALTCDEFLLQATVWRIEPAGGGSPVHTVPMAAKGLAIDNGGRIHLGGAGPQGTGLYRVDPNGLVFLGTVPADVTGNPEHWVMLALVSGDVLVARTRPVLRFVAATGALVPFFTPPLSQPMPGSQVMLGFARAPHNRLGAGALIGFGEMTGSMGAMTGAWKAVSTDLTGATTMPFAEETFAGGGMQGMGGAVLASGVRNDTWWLSMASTSGPGNPAMTAVLHRIEQTPADGIPGSLFLTATPGHIAVDLDGPPAAPFLLGVATDPFEGMFAPGWGWIDVSLVAPNYLAVFDGPGAFGAGNPTAVIPPSGRFVWSLTYPKLPVPVRIATQALILAPGTAPNGGFYVSNVVGTALR